MRKFLEMEAELGSENEKHDHKRKKIRGNEGEEDGSDLDDSLDGFVDYADDKEIGGANERMLKKFQEDADNEDQKQLTAVYKTMLLGQNRKRKRGEVDLEDLNEDQMCRLRRFEQRAALLQSNDPQEFITIKKDAIAVEEELSETELQLQKDQNEFYKFRRDVIKVGEENLDKYTNIKKSEQQEEEFLGKFMT